MNNTALELREKKYGRFFCSSGYFPLASQHRGTVGYPGATVPYMRIVRVAASRRGALALLALCTRRTS